MTNSKLPEKVNVTEPSEKSTSHSVLPDGPRSVDVQYLPAWKFVKGWPLGKAGLSLFRSKRLASSLRFGKRQAPARLPSERPHAPLAKALASPRATDQPMIP